MTSSTEQPGEIATRVLRIVAATKKIPPDAVTPDSTLEELGIDSLDRLNILFDLEKEFNIEINDEDARRVRTVADMIAGVDQLVAARNA